MWCRCLSCFADQSDDQITGEETDDVCVPYLRTWTQPINSPTDAWTGLFFTTTRRYSLWYVLYSFLVGTVRYGTVYVLVCSTTHHYHRRRITEKKKKKGKKEAERWFCVLASCHIVSTLCRVYGDLDARALWGMWLVLYCTCYPCISVQIAVVWLQCLRFIYVRTLCIGGCTYPSSIHYVSIPHV